MKRLTLLRHAKSTWDDPVARDFDRPLNRRGRRAARTMGLEMKRLELRFDKVIASSAARVVETLAELAQAYGDGLAPELHRNIYLAPPETLLECVRATPETIQSLLVVGHNPGLESLTLLLTAKESGTLREQAEVKYPTAALAEISLPVEHWREVKRGEGKLERFIRPRDLDPELGPDE